MCLQRNTRSESGESNRNMNKEFTMKRLLARFASAALFACVLAAPAGAQEIKAGDLVITQAWSRATPSGAKVGGAYVTIENKGAAPDRLVGGSADVAGKVEVHEMATIDGVMKMRQLEKGLTIEPGKTVKLAPGGYHLMLFDLKSPLKQGDKVPVTLQFEKAGKVQVSLDVQAVGAQSPSGAAEHGGKMQKMPDHSGMKM
jgi:copper(I)-binding protein